jgi:hypothetical protein
MVVLDRVTLGWLLLVWEPLFILSVIGLVIFLLGLSAWVFRYGMRGLTAWLLLALTLASTYGCTTVPFQILESLQALTSSRIP